MSRTGRAVVALASRIGACGLPPAGPSLEPVAGFELERRLGTWHEIATVPSGFQRALVTDTTAACGPAPEDPGRIAVHDPCRTASGEEKVGEGRARSTGPHDRGALEVTFPGAAGDWLPATSGAWLVIALDPGCRWAPIDRPSRDHARISAREPRLADAMRARRCAVLAEAGYDSCRLVLPATADPRRGARPCRL